MITSAEEYNNMLHRIEDVNKPAYALLLPSEENIYEVNLNTRTVQAPGFLSVEKDHTAETIYFIVDRFYSGIDLANTACIIQFINKGVTPHLQRYYPVPYYDISTYSSEIIKGYIPIVLRAEDYKPGRYYILDEETREYILADGGYDSSLAYFKEVDQTPAANKKYIKAYVEYSNYAKEKYYIINDKGEYELDLSPTWDPNKSYYNYVDKPKIIFPWVIGGEATAAAGEIEFAIQFYMLSNDGTHYQYCLNTKPAKSSILYGMDVTEIQNSLYPADTLEHLQQQIAALSRADVYWINVDDMEREEA